MQTREIMDHVFSTRRLKIGQHREEIEPFTEFIRSKNPQHILEIDFIGVLFLPCF